MFAKQFVGDVLTIFERRGIEPITFEGEWRKNGIYRDNYTMYEEAYRQTV
jgi:hypothetical protein